MKRILILLLFAVSFTANISYGQLYIDYSNIDKEDIIDALAFSGVEIFKFKIDSLEEDHDFYLIAEEYAGKDILIQTDTLLGGIPFKIPSERADQIRILTKNESNSFKKVSLFINVNDISTWKELEIKNKYARKHYWVKFEESGFKVNKHIPLLFFGSEWDTVYNGEKTTRFCASDRIPLDLSGDAFDEIPHFIIPR